MTHQCQPVAVASETNQVHRYLSRESFGLLEQKMICSKYKTDSILFWEGDTAKYIYFIYKGQVKISKTTEEGKELIFYFLQAGDMFGEFGGFEEVQHSFSARAMEDVEIGAISLADLESAISKDGKLAVEFIKWMGVLQRTTESKFRDLLLYGKTGALASTLIRLSNSYGKLTPEGIQITIKLTNTELANMIGTARESVNRMLSDYKSQGIISFDHGIMTIHQLHALQEVVSCPGCSPDVCRI
jgi:CRP/FNR family transcriptional regulator